MVRLFSFKNCLRYLICLCLFLAINVLLFKLYSTSNENAQDTSNKSHITDTSFSFDRTNEQNIRRYFERKKQLMKQSSFKIVLPNALQVLQNKTSFLIYEYTRHRQFCRKSNSTQVYLSTCPFRNCYFTCNTSLIHEADAILAYYSSGVNYTNLFNLRANRNLNQIWLLWHDEPGAPSSIYNKMLFNWTITYRLDSEVSVASYGITLTRNEAMHQSTFNNWIKENYEQRCNQAVWFVSNCRSRERLRYYEQLKEYYSISAFGKCVTNEVNKSHQCTRRSSCEVELLSTSKFYLAFESTASRLDYITEKFWRSFSHGVIPIVLGPKRHDYERVAPPHSFIYANDYPNPQTLAKHLINVATNLTEYEKYHQWRLKYETRYLGQDVEPFRFCELCYKLNTNRDRIWYTDIHNYFLETI